MNLDLFPHKDKVIYNKGNFIILDGIDIEAKKLPIDGCVSVNYINYGMYITFMASKEMYEDVMFWQFARTKVANKLCELKNERIYN